MDGKGGNLGSCFNRESSKGRQIIVSDDNSLDFTQWDKIDDMIGDSILARLPVFDYFRCQFVSKRWESMICSTMFKNIFDKLFTRQPWFLMIDWLFIVSVIYDKEVNEWRFIRLHIPKEKNGLEKLPLVSSNGLICFISHMINTGILTVCNPLTGSRRDISIPFLATEKYMHARAITIHSSGSSFQLFIILQSISSLVMKVFSAANGDWDEKQLAKQTISGINYGGAAEINDFLQYIPPEDQVGLNTIGDDGQVTVYYFTHTRILVGCDSKNGIALMYPPVVPLSENCVIGLVQCGYRILFVVFIGESEEDQAVLLVREFNNSKKQWEDIARMPQGLIKELDNIYAEDVSLVGIKCTGYGNYIMVCMLSDEFEFDEVMMYNLAENVWVKLPKCMGPCGTGSKRFISACAFVPNMYVEAR